MANAYFEYNGKKSSDFGIRIQTGIKYPSPEADVERVEAVGRDGDLIVDNERMKSMSFPIPIRIDAEKGGALIDLASEINGWLKSDLGFHPLILSTQPDFYYNAIIIDGFEIEETLKEFGRTVVKFELDPYKRAVDPEKITVENGDVISNPENRIAKPIVHVTGTGDIDIKNNGEDWLSLRSVDTEITVDSELKSVYREERPQYNKMVDLNEGSFPLLEPGDNKLTWTGAAGITGIEVEPQWERLP